MGGKLRITHSEFLALDPTRRWSKIEYSKPIYLRGDVVVNKPESKVVCRNSDIKVVARQYAKELRDNATFSEKWFKLFLDCVDIKYKFQHEIYPRSKKALKPFYIVDFYLPDKKIVIEVDGGYHDEPAQRELDKRRSKDIKQNGYKVFRFSNEQARNVNYVLHCFHKYMGYNIFFSDPIAIKSAIIHNLKVNGDYNK